MNLLVKVAAAVGAFVAATATSGCILAFFDEPEMPESLL